MKHRCFVGLRINADAVAKLVAIQDQLAQFKDCGRAINLVPEGNLHLTLQFLGSITDETLEILKVKLGRFAPTQTPFEADLNALGAFPEVECPRAVFASVNLGHAELVALGEATNEVCKRSGIRFRNEKERKPHVTLARIDHPRFQGPLCEFLKAFQPTDLGRVETAQLVLFESIATDAGSRYQAIAEWTLGAPAA